MKNVVRDLREAAGLSQYELGERAGVAQPNIAAYEAGRSRPPATMLQRLRSAARALPHDALDAHRDDLVALAARYGLSNIRVFGSALRRSDTPGSDPDNVPRLAMESLIIKVGENVARLSAETIGRHPNVPSSAVKRMGDRLAHHYAGTDYDAVCDTLIVDFPAFARTSSRSLDVGNGVLGVEVPVSGDELVRACKGLARTRTKYGWARCADAGSRVDRFRHLGPQDADLRRVYTSGKVSDSRCEHYCAGHGYLQR